MRWGRALCAEGGADLRLLGRTPAAWQTLRFQLSPPEQSVVSLKRAPCQAPPCWLAPPSLGGLLPSSCSTLCCRHLSSGRTRVATCTKPGRRENYVCELLKQNQNGEHCICCKKMSTCAQLWNLPLAAVCMQGRSPHWRFLSPFPLLPLLCNQHARVPPAVAERGVPLQEHERSHPGHLQDPRHAR